MDETREVLTSDEVAREIVNTTSGERDAKFDDFVEREIIVQRKSYEENPENVKKYFIKQVTYPNKGVWFVIYVKIVDN